MITVFRKYKGDSDFDNIRNTLIDSYSKINKLANWSIGRLNFCKYFVHDLKLSKEIWENNFGIWENERGEIVSAVFSEGENCGEAYFLLTDNNPESLLLEEMFAFAESNLQMEKDGKVFVNLRIPDSFEQIEKTASERGYQKTVWREPTSILHLDKKFEYTFPDGFSIKNGNEVSDEQKAEGHIKAFNYAGTDKSLRTHLSYKAMSEAPDYNPEFDLYIVDNKGSVASFCSIWADFKNQTCLIEPVGTIPEYRKMGLARAVIYECMNRATGAGIKEAHVDTDKGVYLSIGFKPYSYLNIWQKVF